MISLRTASLMMSALALALCGAFVTSVRTAQADTPTPQAGQIIIHKHCDPEESEGTFDARLDFEFDPAGLAGLTTPDADIEFDVDFEIACGDGDSTSADGDTVMFEVGTDLSALVTWLSLLGAEDLTAATLEIREVDLPEGVTATYGEGCDLDLIESTITLGLACVITNTFDEDGDDDPDCPACGCCGFDLDIDIDNDNNNTIGIDNDNTNNNANDNDNLNANANTNENENDNKNENTQDQENNQDQSNENDQTNNIDSSPEVNISGVLADKPAPPPSGDTGGQIKPPSTGDAGLARGDGTAAADILLVLAVAGGLGVAGLRAAGRSS